MATLADNLAKSLAALGIKYVFGIPGGPSIPFMEALKNNGIGFVLVSNEQSAGIMADVFGRLTGIPGVCHATFGPGATNLTTGVGEALLDRSPVIAFTTEVKVADINRKVQMNIDHQSLYRPITKWTARLSRDNFKDTIQNAFRIAASETPGPVHIGLPSDICDEMLEPDCLVNSYQKEPIALPDQILLDKAGRLIEKAKKPILAIGLTALRHGLSSAIRKFVGKNNIPVLLTPMAKGIIPVGHPCYAGVLFHAKSDMVASVYRNADLVIGLGYDPIEFNYESWLPKVPLIHIDTEKVDITAEYVACDITGSLGHSLDYLNNLELPSYNWDFEKIIENKYQMFESLLPVTDTFNPSSLIAILQEELPEDSILTGDVGAHIHLLGQLWKPQDPNSFLMTNGWSGMGFGIPAAIGAKLCKPDKTVVCVTGDGGFLMNCGEIMTARRLGINVVIIVLSDKNLSLIEVKQIRKGVAQYGTSLYEGEYFQADRFFGAPIIKVCNESELKKSLKKAFSVSGPVIIEAVIDGSVYNKFIAESYK